MIDWLLNYSSLALLVTILCAMHFLGKLCTRGHSQRAAQPAEPQSQIDSAANRVIGRDDPDRGDEGPRP